MKINKQFLIFKNRLAFERELANETINETSIAFIKEEELIWTHGTMFGGDLNLHSHAKGYFSSVSKLPHGEEGDWAIVNEDGTEYIYYYDVEDGWVKGGEYKSDDYVLKANLLDYIKNFYDNVYVRKDEVYTPDQYDGDYDSSSESPGGSTTVNPGYTFNVDQLIDKNSFNPVANWVIYNALKNKVDTSVLNDYLTFEQFLTLAANILAADLTQYYTKNQTYSKDQVYNKNQTYSKSEIDNISNTWLKIVTIEQSSYEELLTYEPNTIYFVLEPQTQTNWTFGGTFPITFASDGIGTFPITLQ